MARPDFSAALNRLHQAWCSAGVRKARDRVELALGVVAAGYLTWKLSRIGWAEVARALPANPWFYLLLIPRFLAIPVAEMTIYARLWSRPMGRYWPEFLRKLAYNFGFLEYTGELYFAAWAPEAMAMPARRVLSTLKDVNITSALTANFTAAALFAGLAASGQAARLLREAPALTPYFVLACLFIAGVTVAGVVLWKRMIGLGRRDTTFVVAVHAVRLVGGLMLQVAQWALAIPNIPLGVWLVFLATNMVVTRIPMIPSRELVFAGLSLTLLGLVNAPQAQAAAALAGASTLMQVAYCATLLATSVRRRTA